MIDKEKLDKLKEICLKCDPIYTDLYGDRYAQGSWSRVDLDYEQDKFISVITPEIVLELIEIAECGKTLETFRRIHASKEFIKENAHKAFAHVKIE